MTTAERQGCAYHEAGHAIVGKLLGRIVWKVQIGINDDPSKGQTHFNDSVSLDTVEGLAICCAGLASERMFSAPLAEKARFADRYCAEKILQAVPEAQWPTYKRAGYRRAWRLLSKNRDAVIELANQLIQNGIERAIRSRSTPRRNRLPARRPKRHQRAKEKWREMSEAQPSRALSWALLGGNKLLPTHGR